MRVLAFDTATRATTVALIDGADDGAGSLAVQARDDPPPGERPRHTTRLMSLIVQVLEGSQTHWRDLDRIAVGLGPGSFTGLRIGVATARGLASAHGTPLVGVSTLESLALGAASAANPRRPPEIVLAVLDARRGEVFAAAWPAQGGSVPRPRPLLGPTAISPQALAEASSALGLSRLAVGDGAIEYRAVLEGSGTRIPEDDSPVHRVSAIYHGRLAIHQSPAPPDRTRPEYLRLPDAELTVRAAESS